MNIDDLRETLAYWHDQKNMRWREVAELPYFRGVSFSTLNAIYNGREPKDPITRERLGLPQHETCGMCHTFNRFIREATQKETRLDQLPIKALRVMLKYREDYNVQADTNRADPLVS